MAETGIPIYREPSLNHIIDDGGAPAIFLSTDAYQIPQIYPEIAEIVGNLNGLTSEQLVSNLMRKAGNLLVKKGIFIIPENRMESLDIKDTSFNEA